MEINNQLFMKWNGMKMFKLFNPNYHYQWKSNTIEKKDIDIDIIDSNVLITFDFTFNIIIIDFLASRQFNSKLILFYKSISIELY